ncbi:MAG TPA: hypothetical protein VLJ68_04965 [Chitinophagaceae bacterium]|nr:hypothetical protein [Chitinophagaceae bacterium]
MNITRHNYEEYFILYIDNELGVEQRLQVESFVQKNPDLKEELDTLLQFKLVPDTAIVFDNKSQLIKPENHSALHLANFEEWLVLYLDNELSEDQKALVEEFIQTQPEAQQEWALLQRTRLQPETIVFANKESLYRRDVKRIPVLWWRVAAAAILVLAAGITLFVMLNKGKANDHNELVNSGNKEQKIIKESPVVQPKDEKKEQPAPVIANTVTKDIPAPKQSRNELAVKQKAENNKKTPVQLPEEDLKKPVIAQNDIPQNNNLPQPTHNPNAIEQTNPITKRGLNTETNINNIKIDKAVTNPEVGSSDLVVTPVVYKEPVTQLEQPEGKKSKLRGFFRKLARTFEKTTNMTATDDDRLLIGGLAIKLK